MSREPVKIEPHPARPTSGSSIYAGLRAAILDPVRWEAYNTPAYRAYRRRFELASLDHRPGDFPIHLEVEATNDCNLACPFCLRTQRERRGEISGVNNLDQETFKRIIDQGVDLGLASLKFGFQGESLLHPDLPAMVAHAKVSGLAEVMINTNGTLLDQSLSREIVRAGVDRIIFSIDSIDPKKFGRLRPGADFDRIVENFRTLGNIRGHRVTPILQVQGLFVNRRAMDPDEFIDFWRGLAEMVSFSEIIDFHDIEENPTPEGFVCPETFQKLAIWSDGRISPCCSDINLHFQLGRVPEVSLRQVWNGPAMSHIRRMHIEGRAAEFPACRACWRLRIEEEER